MSEIEELVKKVAELEGIVQRAQMHLDDSEKKLFDARKELHLEEQAKEQRKVLEGPSEALLEEFFRRNTGFRLSDENKEKFPYRAVLERMKASGK